MYENIVLIRFVTRCTKTIVLVMFVTRCRKTIVLVIFVTTYVLVRFGEFGTTCSGQLHRLVVEYGYVPVIRVRYGTYQKIKCAVPACRTMDVPANLTVTSC